MLGGINDIKAMKIMQGEKKEQHSSGGSNGMLSEMEREGKASVKLMLEQKPERRGYLLQRS